MGHKLVFNGIDSSDYGIIISGAGTYATPERDIASLSVPGRNGDIHFDNGRYNNIQVTYECGISKGFELKYLPFMRQMLSAPVYSRLEDDYHLDEFRLGTFRAEMVPDVGTIMRSGKFELVFDCKPQRYLKAGERVALTVEGTSASSLLVAEGLAGDICSSAFKTAYGPAFSRIENMRITVIDGQYLITGSSALRLYYPEAGGTMLFGYGDDPTSVSYSQGVQLGGPIFKKELVLAKQGGDYTITPQSGHSYILFTTPARWEMFGVLDGTIGDSAYPDSDTIVNPTRFDASPTLHITLPASHIMTDKGVLCINDEAVRMTFDSNNIVVGQYSKPMTDLYIDCETMNAYTFSDGGIFNLNANVTLPDGQILLQPGENTVYTNDAIDSIEIIPNWWRL